MRHLALAVVRAKALSHEIQYGQHLLARHVELFDHLVDAEVFEVRPAHPTIK